MEEKENIDKIQCHPEYLERNGEVVDASSGKV